MSGCFTRSLSTGTNIHGLGRWVGRWVYIHGWAQTHVSSCSCIQVKGENDTVGRLFLSLFLRSPPSLPSSHGIYRPRARRGRLNKIWILITRLYTDIQLTYKGMRIFLVSSITVSQSLAANCWHWCAEWLNNLPTHKSTTWCNSRRPFIASSTRWRRIPWQHAARRPPCHTIISSHYTLRSTR